MEKYAYLVDVTATLVEQSENCEAAVTSERFFPAPYCVGLQNNSAYNEPISNVYVIMTEHSNHEGFEYF